MTNLVVAASESIQTMTTRRAESIVLSLARPKRRDVLRPLIESWLFFFSSRRRHTRFDCDWSSDVCSSDLDCSAVGAFHNVEFFFLGCDALKETAQRVAANPKKNPFVSSETLWRDSGQFCRVLDRKSVV